MGLIYGVEAEYNSIFGTTVDSTKFEYLDNQIAVIINLYVNNDPATNITDTEDIKIAKGIVHMKTHYIEQYVKSQKTDDPIAFMALPDRLFQLTYAEKLLLNKIGIKDSKRHIIKFTPKLTLPSHSD